MTMHSLVMLFADPIRRCRNEGGHDLSWCSARDEYKRENGILTEVDPVCIQTKPKYRICHISALNGDDTEAFAFTNYSYFTHDDAVSACEKIGASLPSFQQELDAVWLQKAMEYLISYVQTGWPFSMKWITWPVSNNINF